MDLGYSNIRGVDISLEQVAAANASGLENIEEQDLFAALEALGDHSMDTIISIDVVEHLARPDFIALADAVHRALKPGGRWIIHTVNAESPYSGRIRYGDLTHELAYTRASIAQGLRVAGFSGPISCRDSDAPPHGIASLVRWIIWKVLRAGMVVRLGAEIGGDARNAVLTQNLIAVAIK